MPERTLSARSMYAEIVSVFARAADCTVSAAAAEASYHDWLTARPAAPRENRPLGETPISRLYDPEQGYGSPTWQRLRKAVHLEGEKRRETLSGGEADERLMVDVVRTIAKSLTFLCPIPPPPDD